MDSLSTKILVSSVIIGIGFAALAAYAIYQVRCEEISKRKNKDRFIDSNIKLAGIMNLRSSVVAISCVGLLALGYVAGAIFHFPFEDKELVSGNIKKVKSFNKPVSPEVKAELEKLANDTLTQNQTILTGTILLSRSAQMNDLANSTLQATEGIESLSDLHEYMQRVSRRSSNSLAAAQQYIQETSKVISGEGSNEYEQTRNNAVNAFMLLVKDVDKVPSAVDDMSEYLKENNNAALADAVAGWMIYAAENAIITDDKAGKKYWKSEIDEILSYSNGKESGRQLGVNVEQIFNSLKGQLSAISKGRPEEVQLIKLAGSGLDAIVRPMDLKASEQANVILGQHLLNMVSPPDGLVFNPPFIILPLIMLPPGLMNKYADTDSFNRDVEN